MSQKYKLPCHCSSHVAVEVRQAGGTVNCEQCASVLDVPKLRDLKKLELIVDSVKSRRRAGWSALQGALFALGLVLVAIAAGAAYYTYSYRVRYDAVAQPAVEDYKFDLDIQQIPLVDSWQAWKQFKGVKLASRPTPYHVFARDRSAALNKWLTFFGILGGAGLLSMIASLVIRTGQYE